MNNYASSTATDFMEAYYKVALERVIDDFSVLAVETCLIEELPTLFCPEDVLDLDDVMVAALASEDEESSVERARCNGELKVLEDGLMELKSVQEYPSALNDTISSQSLASKTTGLKGDDLDEVFPTELVSRDVTPEADLEPQMEEYIRSPSPESPILPEEVRTPSLEWARLKVATPLKPTAKIVSPFDIDRSTSEPPPPPEDELISTSRPRKGKEKKGYVVEEAY